MAHHVGPDDAAPSAAAAAGLGVAAIAGAAPTVTALYVPGDRPDRFDKAAAAKPDVVILDLEDAVAPANKTMARSAVADYLSAGTCSCNVQVRINARGTAWWADDLATLSALPITGIRLPKVESAADVAAVCDRVGAVPVHALVETAAGVEALSEIARSGAATVGLGEADLASDLGTNDVSTLQWIRTRLVVACRGAGLPPPMMSAWTALNDESGLIESCRIARRQGFLGRAAIHPQQLPPIRLAFTPTQEEVAHATQVLGALAGAIDAGHGVAVLADGSMLDRAMWAAAQRVVDLAQHLGQP